MRYQFASQSRSVGTDLGQRTVIHLDRRAQKRPLLGTGVANAPEPTRVRPGRREPLFPLGALSHKISLFDIELVESSQRLDRQRPEHQLEMTELLAQVDQAGQARRGIDRLSLVGGELLRQ